MFNNLKTIKDEYLSHFSSFEHQMETSKYGIYFFLLTELLLFFVLFFCYFFFYFLNASIFKIAHEYINLNIGMANTFLMLTSSFCILISLNSLKSNLKNKSLFYLFLTILFSLCFLFLKFIEYKHKFSLGLLPGYSYCNGLLPDPDKIHIYFGLYFLITGTHVLHLIFGIFFLFFVFFKIINNSINYKKNILLEFSSLYWHLIDFIWLFIFTFLYILS